MLMNIRLCIIILIIGITSCDKVPPKAPQYKSEEPPPPPIPPDPEGPFEFSKTYGDVGAIGHTIFENQEGNFIISGLSSYNLMLLKLTPDGKQISYDKLTSALGCRKVDLYPVSDDHYIVFYSIQWSDAENFYGQFHLLDINNNLNNYSIPSYSSFNTVGGIHATGSGYTLLGTTGDNQQQNTSFIVIKLDRNFNEKWHAQYGGNKNEWGQYIIKSRFGGYLLIGHSYSFGQGDANIYAVKIDNDGILEWQNNYGGTGWDKGYYVQQTIDGGYIICGETDSFGSGWNDLYLMKIDNLGNLEWEKTFGGPYNDSGAQLAITNDGGYIIIGTTQVSSDWSDTDVYLVKTTNEGDAQWTKTFNGIKNDSGLALSETSDGGYVLLCRSNGIWVIKIL